MIYLDNNATTAIDKKVLEEMLPYLRNVGWAYLPNKNKKEKYDRNYES